MFEALLLAQAAPQAAPPQTPPASDDVIVEGLRDIEQPDSPITARTLGSQRTGSAVASRSAFALSATYASCVGRQFTSESLRLLRLTLDGVINGARQQWAQNQLALIRRTCVGAGGNNYYERGALFLEALRRFAPDLKLTKKETGDTSVQGRFNRREVPLARFRLPQDRDYFEATVCFTRLQPELAVALTRAGTLAAQRRVTAAIVTRARACVGNARHVYVDGTQFRFYIADAVYRWTTAARGVATLVPTEG